MSLTCYLAGNMSDFYLNGEYDNATKWRQYAKSKFKDVGIKVFNPTENSVEHFKYPAELDKGIILQNYTYLSKCDLILVNLEKYESSIGSIWETCIAWEKHMPVIAFGECLKWQDRPHFKDIITVKLDTVEDACDYIISMFDYRL